MTYQEFEQIVPDDENHVVLNYLFQQVSTSFHANDIHFILLTFKNSKGAAKVDRLQKKHAKYL